MFDYASMVFFFLISNLVRSVVVGLLYTLNAMCTNKKKVESLGFCMKYNWICYLNNELDG